MKKSSKSLLKKRSLDISLQHKNEGSYKFSKKKKKKEKLLHLAEKRAAAERVRCWGFLVSRQLGTSACRGLRGSAPELILTVSVPN